MFMSGVVTPEVVDGGAWPSADGACDGGPEDDAGASCFCSVDVGLLCEDRKALQISQTTIPKRAGPFIWCCLPESHPMKGDVKCQTELGGRRLA